MNALSAAPRPTRRAETVGTVVLDPLEDPRWAGLVARSPDSTIFHSPAWTRLVASQYRYPAAAVAVEDAAGELRAGMPICLIRSRLTGKRLVGQPFSDHCGPLRGAGGQDALPELTGALRGIGDRFAAEVQVRGWLPDAATDATYLRHVIPLAADPEAVTARYHRRSQLLRGVRKARRAGLVVERREDAAALAEFYTLHLITRRRQGVPTQPRRFVMEFQRLFAAGHGCVVIVRDGSRAVAAAVMLRFADQLMYKFGASDPSALHNRPNNLLFHDTIEWACREGLRTLDLGRTDVDHESLRAFKRSWGADESELVYSRIGGSRTSNARSRGPADLAAPLIRRGPPLVGRALGEVFYRHFG